MAHHWQYDADLPAKRRHSIQVQTSSRTADFNLLVLDDRGIVIAADRGPEPGARCIVETRTAQRVKFVVELLSGSGAFSLQVASQPIDAAISKPDASPKPPSWATAAADAAGATGSDLTSGEAKALLDTHNQWRSRFGVAPLRWSTSLSAHAQEWADELEAAGMQMRHRSPNDFGENLYWCSGRPASPAAVVDAWGSEEALYNYDANNWWPEAGHFSQLVWHNTTEVGGAVVRAGGQELWVCNYDPRGNWTGQRPYEK